MSKSKLHPDVTGEDDGVGIRAFTACTVTIWGVVILGYFTSFVIEQYYGYAMYYGMIVFLVPAIIVTIVFILYRIIEPRWALRNPEIIE